MDGMGIGSRQMVTEPAICPRSTRKGQATRCATCCVHTYTQMPTQSVHIACALRHTGIHLPSSCANTRIAHCMCLAPYKNPSPCAICQHSRCTSHVPCDRHACLAPYMHPSSCAICHHSCCIVHVPCAIQACIILRLTPTRGLHTACALHHTNIHHPAYYANTWVAHCRAAVSLVSRLPRRQSVRYPRGSNRRVEVHLFVFKFPPVSRLPGRQSAQHPEGSNRLAEARRIQDPRANPQSANPQSARRTACTIYDVRTLAWGIGRLLVQLSRCHRLLHVRAVLDLLQHIPGDA